MRIIIFQIHAFVKFVYIIIGKTYFTIFQLFLQRKNSQMGISSSKFQKLNLFCSFY